MCNYTLAQSVSIRLPFRGSQVWTPDYQYSKLLKGLTKKFKKEKRFNFAIGTLWRDKNYFNINDIHRKKIKNQNYYNINDIHTKNQNYYNINDIHTMSLMISK